MPRALVAASFEDFGLTPVEAAAFGTPTVALRYGGYLDTVIEGTTGVFFDTPTASSIADAVRESSAEHFSRPELFVSTSRASTERASGPDLPRSLNR